MQVTKQQLAELMGVAPGHIPRLVQQGLPGAVVAGGGRGRPAQFDAVACLAWQRQQLAADGAASSPRDEYLRVLTERQQLELAKRRGELIEVSEARADFVTVATNTKQRLRRIPSAIVDRAVAVAVNGPHAMKTLLLGEIDNALNELATTIPEAST